MLDLLPPSATPQERALSLATARVGTVGASSVADLWNPQTCPVAILPWLAWGMSVDKWDNAWTEQQKRDVIAASVTVHRVKGTIGGLKAALRPLDYAVAIEENVGGPYRFRVNVDFGELPLSDLALDQAQAIALRVKNVRSWLVAVRAMRTSVAGVFFGCCGLLGDLASVYPYIVGELESINGLRLAMTLFSYETASVYPQAPPRRLLEGGGYRLLEGGGNRLLES